MKLGLSHLADHKFRHNFQDCLNPICSCGQEIETTSHFLLYCLNYRCARKTCFEKINLIDSNIFKQSDVSLTKDLLFRSEKLNDNKSNPLLTSTIDFIQSTERFGCFNHKQPVRLTFTFKTFQWKFLTNDLSNWLLHHI